MAGSAIGLRQFLLKLLYYISYVITQASVRQRYDVRYKDESEMLRLILRSSSDCSFSSRISFARPSISASAVVRRMYTSHSELVGDTPTSVDTDWSAWGSDILGGGPWRDEAVLRLRSCADFSDLILRVSASEARPASVSLSEELLQLLARRLSGRRDTLFDCDERRRRAKTLPLGRSRPTSVCLPAARRTAKGADPAAVIRKRLYSALLRVVSALLRGDTMLSSPYEFT